MSQIASETTYRTTIDLTGEWQFATDPGDDGRDERWYDSETTWPDRERTVEVPHAWQENEAFREYTGTVWYRRTVDVDPEPDRRQRLRFGAVDYEAMVWVNGERVGEHRGGYLPFELDVTDALESGENEIAVAVTDPEDISEIPHGKQGAPWYERVSGIWQEVALESVPEVRVEGVRATPNLDDDTARIEVDVAVATTAGADAAALTDVGELSASITVERDGDAVASASADIDEADAAAATVSIPDAKYWTPETPTLYDVVVELEADGEVVDRYDDYFGMRSIESRDGRLYLNGEPFYMRGALDQGYYPETHYRPFDENLFEEEIRTAKELGFNLLRKHIKPAHPDFLELADRIGILVWEEPANPTVHTERSKQEIREQIRGMIKRDYNHPSVIVWSLYNEEWGIGNPQGLDEETSLWDDETKQEYLADLYEDASKWDPTRVICDNSGWAHVATDINDYHRYFVSPDRADAWADDIAAMTAAPEDNYGATVTDPDDAPLIVSEFGTWGLCDLPAIEEHYGGQPPWFDYDFFDSDLKRPAGVYDRFEETTLPEVFDDWSVLAEAWQRREFRSIKDVIEQMRAEEGVAGYVITEFSDIEWEFNGILDYRREEKVFHDDFARINDDVLVSVEPETHAVQAGETLTADMVVSNDTTEPIEANVEWAAFDQSGTVSVSLDGFGVQRIENALEIAVPDVDGPTTAELSVSLPGAPDNEEPITAVPAPAVDTDASTAVFADHDGLATTLADAGFDVRSSLDDGVDVALLTAPNADARGYVEDGGTALCLPDESGHVTDEEFFEYRELPETESWNLVASLFYRDRESPLADHLGLVPGWELEDAYPYDVVADVDQDDDVHVGYVEGWLANWSAAVTVRERGGGRVGAFTFRVVGDAETPVGTAALADLVTELAAD